MKQPVDLSTLLMRTTTKEQQIASFALLALGIIESLVCGAVTVTRIIELFFNADNCSFVQEQLQENIANAIMSHGVQLPDLFDILPAEEAQREFQQELVVMRSLCLELLEHKLLAA